jgi:hypothetical protein
LSPFIFSRTPKEKAMLSLYAGHVAFSPAVAAAPMRAVRSSSPVMGVSDLVGVSTETGNKVWDPLGLSDNMDESNLKLIRAAEVRRAGLSKWGARAVETCLRDGGVAPVARSASRAMSADSLLKRY